MHPYIIKVKCFKKRNDGTLFLYFETVCKLNSGLYLNDVLTLTNEHYKDILISSNTPFLLEVRVKDKSDTIYRLNKINSSL